MDLKHLFEPSPRREVLPAWVSAVEDFGDDIRLIRLRGDVGQAIGGDIKDIAEEQDRGGIRLTRSLIVDFRNATNTDFSTLSYLISALSKRLARGGRVGVINAPERLRAQMEISKVDSLFALFDSEERAIAELGGS